MIVISSELPEVLAISDRIVTMREGRVTGEIARADATQESLMAMMTAHERRRRRRLRRLKGSLMSEARLRSGRGHGRRRLRLPRALRAADLPHRADGCVRHLQPRFLSSINLFNVMRQVSITGLLAIGMTFVILTAGIDLSIGSLLAFAGLVAAAVAKGGLAGPLHGRRGRRSATAGRWRRSRRSRSASPAAVCRASRSPG